MPLKSSPSIMCVHQIVRFGLWTFIEEAFPLKWTICAHVLGSCVYSTLHTLTRALVFATLWPGSLLIPRIYLAASRTTPQPQGHRVQNRRRRRQSKMFESSCSQCLFNSNGVQGFGTFSDIFSTLHVIAPSFWLKEVPGDYGKFNAVLISCFRYIYRLRDEG